MESVPETAQPMDVANFSMDQLGDPPAEWSKWFTYMFLRLIIHVAKDPYGFLMTVFVVMTPLFMLSAFCAYKLAKELKRKEDDKKQRSRRAAAISKTRKHSKQD